ncbi:WD40-repeat-containing domain protein [Pterulicium gracile]|uniref:WD40-repeat-containing domain protein n=1 Tax=Pterulicium gracile TaxID=1884261 RepID=A0A5C3R2K6_9AGAR|nr:WD40-repeat-containing domain protein [Pterula gracilis]
MTTNYPDISSQPSHGNGLTCLSFTPDGLSVLTGGDDFIIRKWILAKGTQQEAELAFEAEGAVTSIASSSELWLGASADGNLRRYSHDSMEMESMVTSTNGIPVRCAAIDPKGKMVAVTSDDTTVKIVNLDDTMEASLLIGHSHGVRRATWHPTKPILTTSGSDGVLIAWDLSVENQSSIIHKLESVLPVEKDDQARSFSHDCSAVWHPSGDYFFVATRAHEFVTISRSTWSKLSVFSDPDAVGPVTAVAISVNGQYAASASNSKIHIWSSQTKRRLFSTAVSPNTTVTQLAFSPTENTLVWTDYDGAINIWRNPVKDSFPSPVVAAPRRPVDDEDVAGVPDDFMDQDDDVDGEDDWIIDDIGGSKGKGAMEGFRESSGMKEMVSITKSQPAFQPGATPYENKRRYLAYNMMGVIEVTDQDSHNIVNVEFFDQTHSKGYHFTDHSKHDLGYLGECGAVFACQPEADHPAQVLFKPHSRWNSQLEWTYQMTRPDTRILGVAAGGVPKSGSSSKGSRMDDINGLGNVVIATSEGDLTFLSGTGRERRIVGLGADFISIVASYEWVFVVHRAGGTTIDGSQNFSYSLINFEDFSVRQYGVLPLRRGQTLSWVGIAEEGASHRFEGYVHMLTKYRLPHHGSWARIMHSNELARREGKDESYWPVGFSAQAFMCVILKGRQRYPGFPRPIMQELEVKLPFRKEEPAEERLERDLTFLDIERDELGEELTTKDLSNRELRLDKEIVILVQAALKADHPSRVIELCRLLHHRKSLDAAVKLVGHYNRVGLQEKIQALLAERDEGEDRLEVARDRRVAWNRLDRPARYIEEPRAVPGQMGRAFQDAGLPPVIARPGLAPATPQVKPSRYAAETPVPSGPGSSFDPSADAHERKRKRDLADEGSSINGGSLMDERDVPPQPKSECQQLHFINLPSHMSCTQSSTHSRESQTRRRATLAPVQPGTRARNSSHKQA